jgi:hypothetical protein
MMDPDGVRKMMQRHFLVVLVSLMLCSGYVLADEAGLSDNLSRHHQKWIRRLYAGSSPAVQGYLKRQRAGVRRLLAEAYHVSRPKKKAEIAETLELAARFSSGSFAGANNAFEKITFWRDKVLVDLGLEYSAGRLVDRRPGAARFSLPRLPAQEDDGLDPFRLSQPYPKDQ